MKSDPAGPSGKVDESGFAVSLGGVTATGGGDVAAEGTKVELSAAEASFKFPDDLVAVQGSIVSLVLGEGEQPAAPITMTTAIDPKDVPDGIGFMLLSESADGTQDAVEATYDEAAGTITAITDHLSIFGFASFDISAFFKQTTDDILETFGIQYPAPECAGSEAQIGDQAFAAVPQPGAVPCLSVEGNKIVLDVYSTSGLPFTAKTTPVFYGAESAAESIEDIMTRSLQVGFAGYNVNMLTPGQSIRWTFDVGQPITKIDFAYSEGAVVMASLVQSLSILSNFIGKDQAEKALKLADAGSCMIKSGRLGFSVADGGGEKLGEWSSVFRECGSLFVDAYTKGSPFAGLIGVMWALASASPGFFVNGVLAQLRDAAGLNQFTMKISQRTEAVVPVPVDLQDYLSYDAEGMVQYAWSSPDNSVTCSINKGPSYSAWGCFMFTHTWTLPSLSGHVCGSSERVGEDSVFADYPGGPFVNSCLGPYSEYDLVGLPLPTNSQISFNGVTCVSLKVAGNDAMKCTAPKGSAFTMSRDVLNLTQPAG